MLNFIKKTLAAVLVLALVLSVVPAVATTAQAADGDITSGGYVIFEENFDGATNALTSGHTYTSAGGGITINGGLLSIAPRSDNQNQYVDFVLSGLEIPATNGGNRCYVALKAELFVDESSTDKRNASLQILESKYTDNTTVSYEEVDGDVTAIIQQTSGTHIGYAEQDGKKIASMKIRVGARKTTDSTAGTVVITGVRISLVLHQLATPVSKDLSTYLTAKTGYIQLNQDTNFGDDDYKDLIMGDNAVLDLNGHTLTIADGSTLKAAGNAKIVDSSAGKTGKIVCGDGALTIANTAHPTLPIRTADGYVFVEPKLIADQHMLVVEGSQTADKFTLHFRPGFGQEIRENYLSKGNSGIQMSAYITSEDIYGNRYDLQYNGSKKIVLDNMFDGMYASAAARGQMMFEGFEKYQKLEITLELSADGVTCKLPTYIVENSKVTKHYASQFNDGANGNYGISNTTYSISNDGQLNYEGGTMLFALENAIATGANKTLVLEFDGSIPTGAPRAAFEARIGGTRYSIFTANYYGAHKKLLSMDPFTGTKHIRMEIDLETFTAQYFVDGNAKTPVSVDASELSNYIEAWDGLTTLYLAHNGNVSASAPFVIDNLMLYTIAS